MKPGNVVKPLGVFAVVIAVILAGTAVAGTLTGSGAAGTPDGASVDGQSPGAFQPSAVLAENDPEDGEISLETDTEGKRILVDSSHGNQYDRADLAPLADALARDGHEVTFQGSSDGGFGGGGYNATLQGVDAVLILQPTESFSESEIAGLEAFAEGDGRIAVLGDPPQTSMGSGLTGSVSTTRFSAQDLAGEFGLRLGADSLYNIDDERNDNNYESIYVDPADGQLTDGVDRMQFDTARSVIATDDSATVVARAVEGTETLERRQAARYPVAAQNGNFVLVGDSAFVESSERYDVDNEQFVSNLLEFLVTGDKDEDVPSAGGSGGFGGGDSTGGNSTGGGF